MIKVERLTDKNIGLAFSCAKDAGIWGSKFHEFSNSMLIENPQTIFAYGITYDNEPAGHAIVLHSDSPYSPVEGDKTAYIHCFYISPKFRNNDLGSLLFNYLENELTGRFNALFISAVDKSDSYAEFFRDKGFKTIQEDEYSAILGKIFRKSPYSLKETCELDCNDDWLTVNYNPLCPVDFARQKDTVEIIRKEIPQINIKENYPEHIKSGSLCPMFGFYFGKTPILVNNTRTEELIRMLKNMLFLS